MKTRNQRIKKTADVATHTFLGLKFQVFFGIHVFDFT
jgi:hypothetical protein